MKARKPKPAVKRNRKSLVIDMLETRRQLEAGTLPAQDRETIERMLGMSLSPAVSPDRAWPDPFSGAAKLRGFDLIRGGRCDR